MDAVIGKIRGPCDVTIPNKGQPVQAAVIAAKDTAAEKDAPTAANTMGEQAAVGARGLLALGGGATGAKVGTLRLLFRCVPW